MFVYKQIIFSWQSVESLLTGQKTATIRPLSDKEYQKHVSSGKYKYCVNNADEKLILRVRESFAYDSQDGSIIYRAGYCDNQIRNWKPSIHLPGDLPRIHLLVTSVSVKRYADLSVAEMVSDGLIKIGDDSYELGSYKVVSTSEKAAYNLIWNRLYKRLEYKVEANPIVAVVKFDVKEIKNPENSKLLSSIRSL